MEKALRTKLTSKEDLLLVISMPHKLPNLYDVYHFDPYCVFMLRFK